MKNSLSSASLDAFYMVAQLGHFTQAAQRLGLTQSALSQRILNLEKELGTTVFIRERGHLRLTEGGQKLLLFCQQKEALESELLAGLQDSGTAPGPLAGKLRIGGPSTFCRSVILPVLAPLLRAHPEVQLNLVTRELRDLPALLTSGEVDFLVLDREWSKAGMVSLFLGYERNVLVEREGYKGPEIYLDHDEEDQTTYHYLRLETGKRKKIELKRRYLDDIYGIIDGVLQGLGRAVVPRHLIQDRKKIKVLHPQRGLDIPYYLHYHGRSYYTRLQEAVIDLLGRECRNYLES